MNNLTKFGGENKVMISCDVFEMKYPLLFKSKDNFGNIYVDDMGGRSLLGRFMNGIFILNDLFVKEDLEFFDKRVKFEKLICKPLLKNVLNYTANEKIDNIINKKQKKD